MTEYNPYFDGVNDLRDLISIRDGGLAIYGGISAEPSECLSIQAGKRLSLPP
jgi:hypothetical protein